MERNYGEYSYTPVKLQWRWMNGAQVFDYGRLSEEHIALQPGVPTAYLETEFADLTECGLLTEKNGYYLTNVMIFTGREIRERFAAKEDMLKCEADRIKALFDEKEQELRTPGFYSCDMPLNSLRWLMLPGIMRRYFEEIGKEWYGSVPDGKVCPYARIYIPETEEAPKGNNCDPLFGAWESDCGYIHYYDVRFNTPVFQGLRYAAENVLTMLPEWQRTSKLPAPSPQSRRRGQKVQVHERFRQIPPSHAASTIPSCASRNSSYARYLSLPKPSISGLLYIRKFEHIWF